MIINMIIMVDHYHHHIIINIIVVAIIADMEDGNRRWSINCYCVKRWTVIFSAKSITGLLGVDWKSIKELDR